MSFLPLTPSNQLFRMVPDEDERYLPKGAPYPTDWAFQPSSDDRKEAESRGLPVRVSAWDRAVTPDEARCFMSPHPKEPYDFSVQDVLDVAKEQESLRLQVLRDPLDGDENHPKGGHCGIEGLDSSGGSKAEKQKTRLIRVKLAERLVRRTP